MNEKVRGEYEKYAVIMIALLIMLIGGCSAGNKSLSDGSSENSVIYNSSAPEDDVKYTYVCAQYIYYNTADELMKACDIVMSGKVTGISFTVRDGRTNDEVTGNTSESDKEICTVYTVEKESAYKIQSVTNQTVLTFMLTAVLRINTLTNSSRHLAAAE